MNLDKIAARVEKWNSLRYERVYDRKLSVDLLREEYNEFVSGETDVDQLDALCDLAFIAFGMIWKMNMPSELINYYYCAKLQVVQDSIDVPSIDSILGLINVLAQLDSKTHEQDLEIAVTVIVASIWLMSLELTEEQCYKALEIVCDSNDSKSITKLQPDEKGFKEGKGTYYVAPEPRLQELLDA